MRGITIGATTDENQEKVRPTLELSALVRDSSPKVNVEAGFAKAMLQAIDQDPRVIASKNEVASSVAKLRITEAGRDTIYQATVLGGIEDITDTTAGAGATLTANRTLYDGGMLAAKINAGAYQLKSAKQLYLTIKAERALALAHAWIEFERYQKLEELILSRLAVLDPLLTQLESVATAGVGDVSQVAAAQRVVSNILVAEADVLEKFDQAKILFVDGFGRLPIKASYDTPWVLKTLPTSSVRQLVENSPGLLTKYWAYQASEAFVVAVEAQDDFNIGFQLKLQRPFGGTSSNSEESAGISLSRNLFQAGKLKAQVEGAEASAQARLAELRAGYRDGKVAISAARSAIKAMDSAVVLARSNSKSAREETQFLRKQLIIGGSTLESVLTAEARLYDAESREIGFIAERRKAEVAISALSGHFVRHLNLK
jgi:outer membrane protein TolC